MKQISILLVTFLLCFSFNVSAQLKYYDADDFPLLGKGVSQTSQRYDRLPDSLRTVVRDFLWDLSENSSGMAIRFCTNSTKIAVKWNLRFNTSLNHMSATGVKGLDLYCLEQNEWRFVNSARPIGKNNQSVIIQNMKQKVREYLLYLPLYDGISSLSIGVDSLSLMMQPQVDLPRRDAPIVFYGTSIMQGACASRPGMASTNIIGRKLNIETINFGFSGNGRLDLEIAQCMSKIDAALYVLDFVPNASVDDMNNFLLKFYEIIRKQHPITPLIFVEDPIFTHSFYDQVIKKEIVRKNKTLNHYFNLLKARGDKNIYLIHSDNLLGMDGEATVDGIHFTDLGFERYVNALLPHILKCLK